MRKTEEIVIDDTRYSTTQYSAGKAVRLLTRLVKIVGKPLGLIASSGGLDAELKPDLVGQAVVALSENLEADDSLKIIQEILEGTLILSDQVNRPIVFDIDFAGRIGHLFKLLQKILLFQYGDFLENLAQATPPVLGSSVKRAAIPMGANRIKAL